MKNIVLYHDREREEVYLTSIIEEFEDNIHVIRLNYSQKENWGIKK